jgi:endonuclease/exonuclease/phosphatase family metal-dependent hydrolase
MKLRVATYNIHKGITGIMGRPRIHDVRLALHAIDADIVFLQEVQDRNDRLRAHSNYPKTTQLDFLATTGYEHRAYGKNAVYPHGHHGNAILSRHTIRNYKNHDISDHALEKRGMLHAAARVGGDFGRGRVHNVHLICVHFGLAQRSRIRQAQMLIDFVRREIPPKAPLIVGGDFNDWQQRVHTLLLEELALHEVCAVEDAEPWFNFLLPWRTSPVRPRVARTFPAIAPWLTLDRIYVRGLRVLSTAVPKGIAWARRSDHAPLIADLELK